MQEQPSHPHRPLLTALSCMHNRHPHDTLLDPLLEDVVVRVVVLVVRLGHAGEELVVVLEDDQVLVPRVLLVHQLQQPPVRLQLGQLALAHVTVGNRLPGLQKGL